MDHLEIRIFVLLFLVAPSFLAYPFNPRSQSLATTSPISISQFNYTDVENYPVYPTLCFPPMTPSDLQPPLSDCSWIINEELLKEEKLLFQDLDFFHNTFRDQLGRWYPSRWRRDRCVINVASVWNYEQQTLQLFNVVLSANKILKDCMMGNGGRDGGTVPIGSPAKSFYVSVSGFRSADAMYQSNSPRSLSIGPVERNLERSPSYMTRNAEWLREDHDIAESTISLRQSVDLEQRASDRQHGSSLSTSTQDSDSGGALSSLDLVLPLKNASRTITAPPTEVHCFDPFSRELASVTTADCEFIIDEIILRYPNPMSPQTFGYNSSADIDLSQPENEKWYHGDCVIFVRNINKTRMDTFRIVDVASTAQRIVRECIYGTKYAKGGAYISEYLAPKKNLSCD